MTRTLLQFLYLSLLTLALADAAIAQPPVLETAASADSNTASTPTVPLWHEENLDIFAGEVRVLGQFALDRIAVGDGKVLKVEVKPGGEVIVIGQAAGSSSLRLWHSNGNQTDFKVRVSKDDPETRVRMEKMIRMHVRIVEVRKSAAKSLGIDWVTPNGGKANGPALSTAGDFVSNNVFRSGNNGAVAGDLPLHVQPFTTHFGLATGIISQINYLSTGGDAVTLAEPNLSCINGGNASFLAGGEVPYPVTGINGQTSVQFKEYGIKLDISPLADSNGNIYTALLTEVSQIDPSVSVLGAPGLLTRRTSTQMNVKTGETIVISGLLDASASHDASKVPWLGELPVIGRLFRSDNFRNSLSELVVFVTPEIVEPGTRVPAAAQQLGDFATRERERIKSKLGFKLLD